MKFIAIDLETTGLDPKTDTIIEIAAIRFELEKKDGKFLVINTEERSMLIDPGCELKEEVTMITGITQDMLEGREKWESVRERVESFIGDAIIVGHNVLFDIAMLRTHGINLSNNITLDTFELSEIFSQNVESLNLLFLATHYGIPIEGEHRALDDTRLSVGLFIHYLEKILSLGESENRIFSYFIDRDKDSIIRTLFSLCGIFPDTGYQFPDIHYHFNEPTNHTFHTEDKSLFEFISLSGNREQEIDIIEKARKEFGKVLLITNGKKQSAFWRNTIQNLGYSTAIIPEKRRYCSFEILKSFIEKNNLSRKEIIFSIKMLVWLENTKTGILDELKYYGEEREYVDYFRCDGGEYSSFYERDVQSMNEAEFLIGDPWMKELQKTKTLYSDSCTIIRDVVELEDIFRKSESQKISFSEIEQTIEHLEKNHIITNELHADIQTAIAYLRYLFENLQERPEGPEPMPPGDYGETYYSNQEHLWHIGEKWLPLFANTIISSLNIFRVQSEKLTGIDRKILQQFLINMGNILYIALIRNENIGIIIHIGEEDTVVTLIPRDTSNLVQDFINLQSGTKTIITGYGISGNIMQKFLKDSSNIVWNEIGFDTSRERILRVQSEYTSIIEGSTETIILSTSNKHLRNLSKEIQRKCSGIKVFTQGISGGKGKILSMYEKYEGKKILIGLIDSWKDESAIWKNCDSLILAKMPFDPPSDPYYLARTIGMKNNFEEYGCPLAIAKINTLIGRIKSINPETLIYCADDRLLETLWGKKLFGEIL